jgi:hypothetical protein
MPGNPASKKFNSAFHDILFSSNSLTPAGFLPNIRDQLTNTLNIRNNTAITIRLDIKLLDIV